jgi:alginate O-acetyltransferase complex protein AlgJ
MGSFKRFIGRSGRPRGVGQIAVIIAFLTVIYVPAVRMIVDPPEPDLRVGWEDNRPMPKLAWRLDAVLSFPVNFAKYFELNFGYRKNLISMHTKLAGEALHESTSRMVVEGKDGWLFLAETGSIEDYRGLLPFSESQLKRWKQALESRHNWLADRGIHYIFVVCPDKHTIYPEYMPDRINRVQAETRLDQLVRYINQSGSEVEILDLRPALLETKQQHLCYQPQESHWNGLGAFAGYQQIARRLRMWYPDLRILDRSDCELYRIPNPETDLLRLQGKGNLMTAVECLRPTAGFNAKLELNPNQRDEQTHQVTHSGRMEAPIGRLLMMHDSFALLLLPFLAEHFHEGLYVWSKDDNSLPQKVLAYRPDVVIQEIVERRLCGKEPDLFDLAAAPVIVPDRDHSHPE